jgi:hypothetical protein
VYLFLRENDDCPSFKAALWVYLLLKNGMVYPSLEVALVFMILFRSGTDLYLFFEEAS